MNFRMSFEQWVMEVELNFHDQVGPDVDMPKDNLQRMYQDGLSPFDAAGYAADIYGEHKMEAYANELCDWFETKKYSIFVALTGEPEDYQRNED